MTDSNEPTILCIASFFKGNDFIRECKRQGARVVLLTREKLLAADWARESLDDLIAIPGKTSVQSYLAAATHVARHRRVSRVVALEEYDVVTAAHIREHLRVPGTGTTTARCFQDKLAMRAKARDVGIPQTEFVPLFNFEVIDEFMKRTPPPWMLKPRIGASSMGIKKLHKPEDVWRAIADFDAREAFHEHSGFHLLESYTPGDVYHVDSLVAGGKILFASVERYGTPPFEVSQFGGVTVSHTVKRGSKEQRNLLKLNKWLLSSFGFERGVTHAEFIRRANPPGKLVRTVRASELRIPGRVPSAHISTIGNGRAPLLRAINSIFSKSQLASAVPTRQRRSQRRVASIPGVSGPESNSPHRSGPTFCHQFGRSMAALLFHWHVRNIPVLPVIPIPRSYIVYATPGMSASSLARLTMSE